jgi:hypothetical protein
MGSNTANPPTRRRSWLLRSRFSRSVTLLVFSYLLLEGFFLVSLIVAKKVRRISYQPVPTELTTGQEEVLTAFVESGGVGKYMRQDAKLGWTPVENNSDGMRDPRTYDPTPPPNVVRIAAYGDSFTFGEDVTQGESWAAQLAAHSANLEVLNYGVPGYGPDQAYLRYQEHRQAFSPQIVFLGYMTENLARTVSVYRPFYYRESASIFTKPRFSVKDNKLKLLPNPIATVQDHADFLANDAKVLAKLGEHDYHYQTAYKPGPFDFLPSVRFCKISGQVLAKRVVQPILRLDGVYNDQSEAYQVTAKVFDAHYQEVIADGALPIVVILPENPDHLRSRQGKSRRYQVLLDDLENKSCQVIDVLDAFVPVQDQYSLADLTVRNGHYSVLGNEIVADFLYQELKSRGLLDPEEVQLAIRNEQARLKAESP